MLIFGIFSTILESFYTHIKAKKHDFKLQIIKVQGATFIQKVILCI